MPALIDELTAAARAGEVRVTNDVTYEVLGGTRTTGPEQAGRWADAAAGRRRHPSAAGDGPCPRRARRARPTGPDRSRHAGVADLTLDVDSSGGPGCATTMRISFGTPQRRALSPVGRTVPVLIDSAAGDRVAIDISRLA